MPAQLKVVKPTAPPAIASLIEDYLAYCKAKGLSPRTYDNAYAYPLRRVLLPWCTRERITEPKQLTSRGLAHLTAQLLEDGGARGKLSPHSVHAHTRAINHFLSWANKEGELAGAAKAVTPKLPKKLVDVLSREEIDRMEDAGLNERDKLIVRLLADTGIRVGELIALSRGDVFERDRNWFLKIHGKGQRDRVVPLPRLAPRLRRYIDKYRPRDARSDHVFVSLRRRPDGEYEPITASGAQQLVRTLAVQAGIKKRVYPHLLRHSFATWQLQRGTNPITLANILGHSSLAMIQNVYAHLSPSDAYEAMAQALLAEDKGRGR